MAMVQNLEVIPDNFYELRTILVNILQKNMLHFSFLGFMTMHSGCKALAGK